jgi:uncharacterized protein with FMN-binding domain
MRRAVLTLGSTAAGIAALLSFKTHSPAAAAASSPSTVPNTVPSTATNAAPDTIRNTVPVTPGAQGTRSVAGKVANTAYGPMQIEITLAGKKIVGVTILQQTNTGPESQSIDSFSIPKLTAEVLTTQSARIDTVSGATETSAGYIQSLQSAIDKAGA